MKENMVVKFLCLQLRYKNIEKHQDQITLSILYERSQNYDWSSRACLVEDGKKGCKHL